jgi:hypothetical protein
MDRAVEEDGGKARGGKNALTDCDCRSRRLHDVNVAAADAMERAGFMVIKVTGVKGRKM